MRVPRPRPDVDVGRPNSDSPVLREKDFDLAAHTHLLVVAGSRAYGIHLPDSDLDLKGVAIPPKSWYLGVHRAFEQADRPEHFDAFRPLLTDDERRVAASTKLEGAIYEIRKFCRLASEANPNILDVLFCRDEEVRRCTAIGRTLRENRQLFLSAKARFSFSGYAHSQLKRIKGHRAWLLSPPDHQPTRGEFGLPDHTLIPSDQLAAAQAAVDKQVDRWELDLSGLPDADVLRVTTQVRAALTEICAHLGYPSVDDGRWLAAARAIGLDANLVLVMQREREYEAAFRHWKQYRHWRETRNPERAALEERFGYDCKHAGHLVRLLKMGREILTTGEVAVWRGDRDADEIRAIRGGAWSYDRLIDWAERQDAELEEIYRRGSYAVPKQPDRDAIDRLCVDLVDQAIGATLAP